MHGIDTVFACSNSGKCVIIVCLSVRRPSARLCVSPPFVCVFMGGDGDRRWGGKGGQEGYRYRYPYLSYPNPGRILRMLLYSRGILAVRAGLQ